MYIILNSTYKTALPHVLILLVRKILLSILVQSRYIMIFFSLPFIFFFFSRITTRPNRKRQLIIKENRASSNPASRNFPTGETKRWRRIHNAPEKAKQRGQRKKDSVAGLVERTTRINDSPLRAFAFPRLVPRAFLPPPPPPPSFFKHARTNLYFARENQVLLKRRRDEGRFCRLDKRD